MKRDHDWVLAVIDQIYDAATDDRLWPAVIDELRTMLVAKGSTLFFTDHRLRPIGTFFRSHVQADTVSAYQAHYHQVDIRMQRAVPQYVGKIVTDAILVEQDEIAKHEFYQDFLRPAGHRYIVSAILELGNGVHAFASCHFGLKDEHPDGEILDRAALLIPHLKRGLQLRRHLAGIRAKEQAALDVLDQLSHAVFLISEQGRIMWHNATGSTLLEARDGIKTIDAELRAEASKTSSKLSSLIRSAIEATERPRGVPGGLMVIPRPSLKRAYQVLVTPLARAISLNIGTDQLDQKPVVAVFITDPEGRPAPTAEGLTTLYKLTPAEARLATALASGKSVKDYADRERRSIHYVRWLLKQVEAKTDTRRITDLIRLLTSQTDFTNPARTNDS